MTNEAADILRKAKERFAMDKVSMFDAFSKVTKGLGEEPRLLARQYLRDAVQETDAVTLATLPPEGKLRIFDRAIALAEAGKS